MPERHVTERCAEFYLSMRCRRIVDLSFQTRPRGLALNKKRRVNDYRRADR